MAISEIIIPTTKRLGKKQFNEIADSLRAQDIGLKRFVYKGQQLGVMMEHKGRKVYYQLPQYNQGPVLKQSVLEFVLKNVEVDTNTRNIILAEMKLSNEITSQWKKLSSRDIRFEDYYYSKNTFVSPDSPNGIFKPIEAPSGSSTGDAMQVDGPASDLPSVGAGSVIRREPIQGDNDINDSKRKREEIVSRGPGNGNPKRAKNNDGQISAPSVNTMGRRKTTKPAQQALPPAGVQLQLEYPTPMGSPAVGSGALVPASKAVVVPPKEGDEMEVTPPAPLASTEPDVVVSAEQVQIPGNPEDYAAEDPTVEKALVPYQEGGAVMDPVNGDAMAVVPRDYTVAVPAMIEEPQQTLVAPASSPFTSVVPPGGPSRLPGDIYLGLQYNQTVNQNQNNQYTQNNQYNQYTQQFATFNQLNQQLVQVGIDPAILVKGLEDIARQSQFSAQEIRANQEQFLATIGQALQQNAMVSQMAIQQQGQALANAVMAQGAMNQQQLQHLTGATAKALNDTINATHSVASVAAEAVKEAQQASARADLTANDIASLKRVVIDNMVRQKNSQIAQVTMESSPSVGGYAVFARNGSSTGTATGPEKVDPSTDPNYKLGSPQQTIPIKSSTDALLARIVNLLSSPGSAKGSAKGNAPSARDAPLSSIKATAVDAPLPSKKDYVAQQPVVQPTKKLWNPAQQAVRPYFG